MHPSISSFTFGAEFEVLLPRGLDRHSGAAAVARASGLTVNSGTIGGSTANWKVVSDLSVSGNGHGLEFVSPILKGEDGLNQVRKITAALTAIGATINQTCGLHVHVGVRNEPIDFFKNLIKLYSKFEDAIDTIMPQSRRANAARYCRSVKLINPAAIDAARSKEELAQALYRASGADGAKYHKVNLVPHGKPTVEFRHHAGTVDGEKAVNWIVTCLRLVAAAKAGKSGAGETIARDFSRLDAKARAVADAISKPEGATADEIRSAHGFRALSIKRQAAIAGLQVRVVRERGKERFFIVAQTEPGRDVPATLAGLFEVIDASPEEAEFLRARAQTLANL
jgi:hypothetical protein